MSELEISRKKPKGRYETFRLMVRDVEILGFLLDQKFASLEQLYFRFFDFITSSRVFSEQKFPKNFLNEGRKKLDFISLLDLNFFPVGHRQWFQGTTA